MKIFSTIIFFKKRPLLSLFILGFLLRVFLLFIDYSWDLNNHIVWANDLWTRGFSGFYFKRSSEVYASAYPNYPPLALVFFYIIFLINGLITKLIWLLNISFPLFPSRLVFFVDSRLFLAGLLKIPSVLADLGCGAIIYIISQRLIKKDKRRRLILTSLFLFNPAIFYNSAFWGQIDIIPIFFSLSAFYFILFTNKYWLSAIMFIFGLLVKPTILVYFPVYLIFFLNKFGWFNFLKSFVLANIIFIISFTPFLKNNNYLIAPYMIYYSKIILAQSLPFVTNGAFNFWTLITGINPVQAAAKFVFGLSYNIVAYLISGLIYLIVILRYLNLKKKINNFFYALFISSLGAFIFLTKMHERYLILVLPLILFLYFDNKKILKWYVLISFINFVNLYRSQPMPNISLFYSLSHNIMIINSLCLVLIAVFVWLFFNFLKTKELNI